MTILMAPSIQHVSPKANTSDTNPHPTDAGKYGTTLWSERETTDIFTALQL